MVDLPTKENLLYKLRTYDFKFNDFRLLHMSDLPMKNYEDLNFPNEWIKYYKSLTPDGKVKHFESMFRNASEHEKTLIINDLKHFFQAPV